MMHIKYPRKRGFLFWDELGCLARAMGFHENVFLHHLPDSLMIDKLGISIKKLEEAMDFFKYFHRCLDRTYNIHTDVWNIASIKRAMALLDRHVFTFEEIQLIRIVYQLYESPDTRGLQLHEHVLQRSIKMCDRMISPLKMSQRVKHMSLHFEDSSRIQLHEFFDLLLWCELYQGIVVEGVQWNNAKDQKDLFQLDKFEHLLSYYDERLTKDLNNRYIEQELKYTEAKFGSKKMPKDVPPVDPQVRKKQVLYHKKKYHFLHREIGDSANRVSSAQAGYVRGRPVSAPDVLMYQYIDPSVVISQLTQRPQSVQSMFGHIIRPNTAPEFSIRPVIHEEHERPLTREYQRPKTPLAVEPTDVDDAMDKINSLKFEMETLNLKYETWLDEDIDYLLPGYRQRKANRPKPVPSPPPAPPKPEKVPTQATINRLAKPHKRRIPPPSHAKSCDARYRGWYKVKSQRGPHYILVSSQFDTSTNGKLFTKLRLMADREIRREPIVYRHTDRQQVVSNRRPWTSPAMCVSSAIPSPCGNFVQDRPGNSAPGRLATAESDAVDWQQLPVHQEKDTETSEDEDKSEYDRSVMEKLNSEEYLPPSREETKRTIAEYRRNRRHQLTGIKELTEEDAISERSKASSKKVRTSMLSVASSPVATIAESIYSQTSEDDDEIRSDMTTPATPHDDNDHFSEWYYRHDRAPNYPWIREIVLTDYAAKLTEKHKQFDFSRLADRGEGYISPRLKYRLAEGMVYS